MSKSNIWLKDKPAKAKKEQHERLKVRRPCVKYIRSREAAKQFRHFKFFQIIVPPDAGALTRAQSKAYVLDGYAAGIFDMTIVAATQDKTFVWLVEFKWGNGKYTDSQQA